MMKLGIVPMSAKPYHAGHDALVRLASKECDVVYLYVSVSNRGNIKGNIMEIIWKNMIEPKLPGNVIVTYGGSPITHVWELLIDAEKDKSKNEFLIYSDPSDIRNNFTKDLLIKYAPKAYQDSRIILRPIERSSTVDVSGTQMRMFLDKNDKGSFFKFLPNYLNKEVVWNLLKNGR